MFYTYIVKCSDGSLYTGSTNDVDKRLYQHNFLKSGAKYTRGRRPVQLAYQEIFETSTEAKKREAEIKKLTREEKQRLFDEK